MKLSISAAINRLFRKEGINGGYRWTLLRIGWLHVRLHHFTYDDWLGDMHDHAERFISIGLLGKYREETPNGARVYRAPWVRSFPASHAHRLVMVNGGACWTLAITLRPVRTSGFLAPTGWMPWDEYLKQRLEREHDNAFK